MDRPHLSVLGWIRPSPLAVDSRSEPQTRNSKTAALCAVLASLALPVDAAVHQMFVTSAFGTGNLSTWPASLGVAGLAGGDQICQTLAANAGLANPGEFRAWLSTSTTDAYCHVAGFDGTVANNCGQVSPVNAGPWRRVDGQPFSRTLQNLTSTGNVLHPGEVDENGNLVAVAPKDAFTGTDAGGANSTRHCFDWESDSNAATVIIGGTYFGTDWWTDFGSSSCDEAFRLYCFERGSGDPLPPFAKAGAIVFVSSASGTGNLGSWPQAGGATGLAAGDAICQNLASAAGLDDPTSYLAWLSTAGVDAIDRLPAGIAFRRRNGVEIAASKNGLLAPSPFANALETDVEVDELGNHAAGSVFTGTDSLGHFAPGHACNGWTSGTSDHAATRGLRNSSAGSWTDDGIGTTCNASVRLYCFSTLPSLLSDGFESGDMFAWSATTP